MSARSFSVVRGSLVGQGDGGALVEPLMKSASPEDANNQATDDHIESGSSVETASSIAGDGNTDDNGDSGDSGDRKSKRLSTWRVSLVEQDALAEKLGTTIAEGDDVEEKNPWSRQFIGIPINYFSVGLVYGGSVNLLYPVLIIQNGVTSSFFSAAVSLVTVFWSYKIFFGILCDCLPIYGRRWKWYIVLGWILCAACLVGLASMGADVAPINLVIVLTLANLGYVMADVAADGFMVWMAHHEVIERRGKIQTLIYIMREIGRLLISIVIIFGFSGPETACPGYEADAIVPCTTDESVTSRNDQFESNPDDWCHAVCDAAEFPFGLTIPQFVWIIASVNIVSIPAYFLLYEEKRAAEKITAVLGAFWKVMKTKAVWMLVLYTMISSITFNVFIAAKNNANFVWLGLSNAQNQMQAILENFVFLAGLGLIRRYGLNWSWRKMVWAGSLLVTFFNLLYLLIVFHVLRNPWFYIFTDVTDNFMFTLNFLASTFAIVEVSEPGFEAITYALITTANNATIPLSIVISYQFMAFFPELNTQEGLATDTPEVRRDMALLIIIVEAVNLSSLFALPMLVRQKKEAQAMMKEGKVHNHLGVHLFGL